ncbi:MAG: hypothetical protein GX640_07995 [Fibrobacter sp.]|nr:hypothetical protein [Fibrobacter sp.]
MNGVMLRLERLKKNGYYLIIAADHALSNGFVPGIEKEDDYKVLIKNVIDLDIKGVVLTYGLIRNQGDKLLLNNTMNSSLIVQTYGCPAINLYNGLRKPLCSIEDAIAVGGDCVSLQLNLAADPATWNLTEICTLASQAHRYGLPVLLMVGGVKTADVDSFVNTARSLAELPVDLIKIDPGVQVSNLPEGVLCGIGTPFLYAGGEFNEHFIRNLGCAKNAGFDGVCVGRNFFQSDNPRLIVSKINEIFTSNYYSLTEDKCSIDTLMHECVFKAKQLQRR